MRLLMKTIHPTVMKIITSPRSKSMVIALKNENEKSSKGNESMLKRSLRFLYLMRLASAISLFLYLLTRITTTIAINMTKKNKKVSKWVREKDVSVL